MNYFESQNGKVPDSNSKNYNPTSIQLHLTTGRKAVFFLDDAEVASVICEELDGHVFTRGSLIIEGADEVSSFKGSSLIGITVATNPLPKSFYEREKLMNTVVTQLTKDSLQHRKNYCKDKTQGERTCTVCELEFISGKCLYLEFNEVAMGAMGERSLLQHLFSRPSISCRTLDGGFGVFNTAHIVSWSHHPKLEVPSNAWAAESLSDFESVSFANGYKNGTTLSSQLELLNDDASRPYSSLNGRDHLSQGELEFLHLFTYGEDRGR